VTATQQEKVNFILEQTIKAHRESCSTFSLASVPLPPEKRPDTHFIGSWLEGREASVPFWTGAESLAPTGI
jgi:hypothetical protein